ncbi:hypothetical protein GGR56DRAFT_650243 [Xylariaceae sp. FL0804]|nr:hypothetical protein GGR56DRAFT_650243 [Xylariaceae sp. FL0804]
MESKTSRYQSRILREMHQNTENPFSPPSSTGTHGTVTLTSEISYIPEGESTPRFDDPSIKLPSQPAARRNSNKSRQNPAFNINTSVLGRTFPEWKGFDLGRRDGDDSDPGSDTDTNMHAKENVPPSPSASTAATASAFNPERYQTALENDIDTPKPMAGKADAGHLRSRSQMQPTVQDGSDGPSPSHSPARAQKVRDQAAHRRRQQPSSPNRRKDTSSQHGNVTTLLQTLKSAQSQSKDSSTRRSPKEISPKSQPDAATTPNAARVLMNRRPEQSSMSPAGNQTSRSFFLPNLAHMNDFVTGALRWSSLKNGMPVFVKHGRVHDRESKMSPDHHVDFEAIEIPEDEQKIFVSLDKIREEIHALKDHDEIVTMQAEQLQEEVHALQIQIAKYKSRKDSAVGSDSESSMLEQLNSQKIELQEQVISLQARLDKANRKISINEIHTQSFVGERDEALKNVTEHSRRIERLQSDLAQAREELEIAREENTAGYNTLEIENRSLRKSATEQAGTIKRLRSDLEMAREQLDSARDGNTQDVNTLELENRSLRNDNNSVREQWKSLLGENRSLRSHNSAVIHQNSELEEELRVAQSHLEAVREDVAMLKEKLETLAEERSVLQQDNLSLERHNEKFYNDNKALQQKNAVLERRNNDLQDHVIRLEQLLDAAEAETGTMTVDVKEIRNRLESQNRELAKENAEFQQQIIDMQAETSTKRMEYQQERRRLLQNNERLTDQLDQMTRKLNQEDYQYRQGSKNSLHTSKGKPAKVTRIVDPKGKYTLSEMSARSTTSQTDMPMQDDFTQQIDLTQEAQPMMGILKNSKPSRLNVQQQKMASGSGASNRQHLEAEMSGRFSLKSGLSGMSIPSQVSREDMLHHPNSPSGRFELESDHEDNMTSALFIDDITLETKRAAQKQRGKDVSPILPPLVPLNPEDGLLDGQHEEVEKAQAKSAIPRLTATASRVLNDLCSDHQCNNCTICTRINAHRHAEDGSCSKKKTVRVERPVPVTDRVVGNAPAATASAAEDQEVTLRPSQDPAVALAKVIKCLKDEESHIRASLLQRQSVYDECDPAANKRIWKRLDAEMQGLRRRRDLKREQIYDLHDVLEGQKEAALMGDEALDMTIASVLSKDPTWNGILDY